MIVTEQTLISMPVRRCERTQVFGLDSGGHGEDIKPLQ
jgi:hypothetical protein